jgi:hypothetical protein
MILKKICSKCGIEKELSDFYKNNDHKDGHYSQCKDCICKHQKKYYIINKESIIEKSKIYVKKNFIKTKEYQKEYQKSHRDKININQRYKRKEKYKNNSIYKISRCVSHRVNSFLKSKNMRKTNKTFEIVGCTPIELKIHIEKQFIEGMTWDNYGFYGWHIDHKIPLDSGRTEDEIYKLCHYTNLQPMWWKDNLEKGKKIVMFHE